MRTSTTSTSTVNWIIGDHLGSTNVVVDINGNDEMEFRAISRTLYKPWGEVRYQSGTIPTNYTYTGQYSHTADFGLMFYNARWYDPSLGRFAQADTIVPGAGNPMAWDRYAYSFNSPINYSDPSGHSPTSCASNNCYQVQLTTNDAVFLGNVLKIQSQFQDYEIVETGIKGTIASAAVAFLTERVLAAPTLEIPQPVSIAGGVIMGIGGEVVTALGVLDQMSEKFRLDNAEDYIGDLDTLGFKDYVVTFDSELGFLEVCNGGGDMCQGWTFEQENTVNILKDFFDTMEFPEYKDEKEIYLPIIKKGGGGGSKNEQFQ